MRKKTIGEVLRLARINQGLSIEELQAKTDIQMNLLEAMEADDFDQLPSTFYARSFLRKYAWAVELDERIILDAYDSGSMITYEEVDVDEEDLSGRRRSNKKKTSYTTESTITVSGEGNRIEARYKTSKETATVQLAVSDVTSWVSVSGSELEGGVTLSADNKNEKTTVSTKNPVAITLGVVKGVTVTVDNQTVDTSKLTTQTGTVTLTFTTD